MRIVLIVALAYCISCAVIDEQQKGSERIQIEKVTSMTKNIKTEFQKYGTPEFVLNGVKYLLQNYKEDAKVLVSQIKKRIQKENDKCIGSIAIIDSKSHPSVVVRVSCHLTNNGDVMILEEKNGFRVAFDKIKQLSTQPDNSIDALTVDATQTAIKTCLIGIPEAQRLYLS